MWLVASGCAGRLPVAELPAAGRASGEHVLGEQSARFTVFVPRAVSSPGLAVLLPGDGYPGRDLIGERRLRQWATANGFILLSADAPGPSTSDCWWTPHKHRRAAFALDLVERVIARYGVDGQRVHLGGWSGGAFLAFGMPFYHPLPFAGGLVGMCGADLPRADSATDWCEVDETQDDPLLPLPSAEPASEASRRVYLSRTEGDDWVDTIDATADFWRARGAVVSLVDEGPGDHCAYDVTGALIRGLDWVEGG